jgi:hypothetical protein
MSIEICPECGELIEHGGIHIDGEPIPAGHRLLDAPPKKRVCFNCHPPQLDPPDNTPCPPGFYRDLFKWRIEQKWEESND